MQRAYALTSLGLSVLVLVAGIAMVAVTLSRGGGIASLGVVLGASFTALGAARIYLARAGGTSGGGT